MSIPICAECRVQMRCEKNDQWINDPAFDSMPSTYWKADVWKCPGCKHRVIVGNFRRGIPAWEFGVVPDDSIEFRYQLEPVTANESPADATEPAGV